MTSNTKGFLCKNCGHKGATRGGSPACIYHKCLINPETDFCSWHIDENIKDACPICGQSKKSDELIVYITKDEQTTFVCKDCLQFMGQCTTCINGRICPLVADMTEPTYVMRNVRQGMMTMQTQVKNPKLIVKHCQKCTCSDGADPSIKDVVCFKDAGGTLCSNWQILPQLLR